jgi:hypothetical protein
MRPVLLWPLPAAAISANLEQPPDGFTVVDTHDTAALAQLAVVRQDTLVLDPFPGRGDHYKAFADHVQASGCRYCVSGLAACQDVLRALNDASLARASTEELLLALGYWKRTT